MSTSRCAVSGSACRVVKVSESGYYRSLQSAGKPKPWQLLLVKIREI